MSEVQCDVAVLGSGFAGSLTALLLDRIGLRPTLIDRATHPRFAIGESSTPVADLVLKDLARRYDLPWLLPLTKFGTWQAAYPRLGCGRKRGFSYFHHEARRSFSPQPEHATELLVAASSDDAHSDTHWLRADVDAFLAEKVRAAGIACFEGTRIEQLEQGETWRLTGRRGEEPIDISARFVIDATGEGQVLSRALGLPVETNRLHTNSRAIFAHFREVHPWRDVLAELGADVADHPFCCDYAALHQVLDEGWMWQLRFENDVVSAGFALDSQRHPLQLSQPIEDEWHALLSRYPSLQRQFADARVIAPEGGLRRTGRLQRLSGQIAGENWVLLPHTAGFIDPLHSTGIAHTLCGIERLIRSFERNWDKPALAEDLQHYAGTIRQEIEVIDRLVAGCYTALGDFPRFVAYSMLYFAAATTYERRRLAATGDFEAAFLCADDPHFRAIVDRMFAKTRSLGGGPSSDTAHFERDVAEAIQPYNHVGLCDPAAQNMYRYTALPMQ